MLPETTHDESSRQEFVKSFKQYVQNKMLPNLHPAYSAQVAEFEKKHSRLPKDRREIRSIMVNDPGFRTYASANRVSQELQWESVLTSIERQLSELNAKAKELSAASSAELLIDPDF